MITTILLSVLIVLVCVLVYAVSRHQRWTYEQLTVMRENEKIISKNQQKLNQEIINLQSMLTKSEQTFSKDLSKMSDSIAKVGFDPQMLKNQQKIIQELSKMKSDLASIKNKK